MAAESSVPTARRRLSIRSLWRSWFLRAALGAAVLLAAALGSSQTSAADAVLLGNVNIYRSHVTLYEGLESQVTYYEIGLATNPKHDVTFIATSPDAGQVMLSDAVDGAYGATVTLTLTPTNNSWRHIYVKLGADRVDDSVDNPPTLTRITHTVSSKDKNYNNRTVDSISVRLVDNDPTSVQLSTPNVDDLKLLKPGDSVDVIVTLGRKLAAREWQTTKKKEWQIATLHFTSTGNLVPGTHFTFQCLSAPGVSCSPSTNRGVAVKFTGGTNTSQSATVRVTAPKLLKPWENDLEVWLYDNVGIRANTLNGGAYIPGSTCDPNDTRQCGAMVLIDHSQERRVPLDARQDRVDEQDTGETRIVTVDFAQPYWLMDHLLLDWGSKVWEYKICLNDGSAQHGEDFEFLDKDGNVVSLDADGCFLLDYVTAGYDFTRNIRVLGDDDFEPDEKVIVRVTVSSKSSNLVARTISTDEHFWILNDDAKPVKQNNQQPVIGNNENSGGYTPPASLIADVRSYVAETHHGQDHVDRWTRVLIGLGVETSTTLTAMTSTEAQEYADKGWSRWDPVVAELQKAEAAASATPEVTIAHTSGATEGDDFVFTLTATPAPDADISVAVTVAATGDYGVTGGDQTVTIGTGGAGTLTIGTTEDGLDEPHGSITVTLTDGTGYTLGTAKTVAVVVSDDDDPAPPSYTAPASLVADVRSYAAETHLGDEHVNRWKQALEGLCVEDFAGLAPMTASEAQQYADIPWARWVPVAAELVKAEAAGCTAPTSGTPPPPPPPPPPPTPTVTITGGDAVTEGNDVVFTVTAAPPPTTPVTVRVQPAGSGGFVAGGLFTLRTVTIGSGGTATLTIKTVDDSTDEPHGVIMASIQDGTGYNIGSQSHASVAVNDNDDPPAVTPTVTISGGSAVTEGSPATFTLTASPPPAISLSAHVQVTQSGEFAASGQVGLRIVAIDSSGTATLTVKTVDDGTDEAHGSISAKLDTGNGYTIGSQRSASVTVNDNDDPPPTVTISAGSSSVTEGYDAEFTITSTSTGDMAVSVRVTQSGDFGVTTGVETWNFSGGSATFTVATTGDTAHEPDGSVTATIVSGPGYIVGASKTATVTIEDDDPAPALSRASLLARVNAEIANHRGTVRELDLDEVKRYLEGKQSIYSLTQDPVQHANHRAQQNRASGYTEIADIIADFAKWLKAGKP